MSFSFSSKPINITRVDAARELPLEDIRHPPLKALLERWFEARKGQTMPTRAQMQPETVRPALGRIMILQVEPGAGPEGRPGFRYRLIGTEHISYLEVDMTGRSIDEFTPDSLRDMVREHCELTVNRRAPLYVHVTSWREYLPFNYVKLLLPLAGADGEVDQLLVCSCPDED